MLKGVGGGLSGKAASALNVHPGGDVGVCLITASGAAFTHYRDVWTAASSGQKGRQSN